ncbi:MAG TPA: hypothetical protein VLC09_11445 [Polyangiaceae bacterium]|nr:hypothetical protein [Polyangiaceae bacterium]
MAKALQEQRDALAAGASAPPATTAAAPAAKAASLAMKGTMLGVAPPDFSTASQPPVEAPVAPTAAIPSTTPVPSQLKGTMVGMAPEDVAELRQKLDSQRPPAPANEEVNAFGGTVVGTSPFFGLSAEDEQAARERLGSQPTEDAMPIQGASSIAASYAKQMADRPSNAPDDLRAPVFRSSNVPGVPQKSNAVLFLVIGVVVIVALVAAAFVL